MLRDGPRAQEARRLLGEGARRIWEDKRVRDGYDAFSPENGRVVHSDKPGVDRQRSNGLSARATWTGANGSTVTAIATWADSRITYSYDGTTLQLLRDAAVAGFAAAFDAFAAAFAIFSIPDEVVDLGD